MSRADSDHRYNVSRKGKARQARYREAHREERRKYDRERLRSNPELRHEESYVSRRRRDLGRRRERLVRELAELEASFLSDPLPDADVSRSAASRS